MNGSKHACRVCGSQSTGLAEWVPKYLTCEKSTMIGVNPGELCASTSHNKEIVSPQFLFGKQTIKVMWDLRCLQQCSGLLGCDVDTGCMVPDILKECSSFRISAITNPVTKHHIPEDLIPQFSKLLQHTYWCVHQTCHLKSCSDVTQAKNIYVC